MKCCKVEKNFVLGLLMVVLAALANPCVSMAQEVVPDVSGMEEAAALTALEAAGVTVGAVIGVCNNAVPQGHVISQTETPTANGVEVTLVLSDGECLVTVPNLVGLTLAQAAMTLEQIALNVGTIAYVCGGVADTIASHDPVPNSRVAPCSSIDVVIFSGPCMVTVPDVIGFTETQARDACSAVTLSTLVSWDYSDTVPSGLVISQNPVGGTQVEENSSVRIVISLGPEPSVEGEGEPAEGEAAEGEGEPAEGEGEAADGEGEAAEGEGESAEGEGEAAEGEGEAAEGESAEGEPTPPVVRVPVPDISELTPEDAQTALEDLGFAVRIVRRNPIGCAPVEPDQILGQRPPAGTMAPAGSEVTLTVSRGRSGAGPLGNALAGILGATGLFLGWCLFGCPPPPTIIN